MTEKTEKSSVNSHRKVTARDLEIPMGKRTKLYRALEILPGFLSYAMIIALFVLSWISPVLGSIYLLFIITIKRKYIISILYPHGSYTM